jgi:hypothetical protein
MNIHLSMDAKTSQMAYWQKDSPIGQIQNYNSNLPSVMDFTLQDALSKVFMKMMAAGKRND